MAEQTFLNEGGVTVTNSRFMASGQTYAMSGVTSVKSVQKDPSRKGPIIVLAIGLIALMAGKDAIVLGIICLAGGIAWWVLNKPKFLVILSSASGEVEALTSQSKEFIGRVVNALNEAIIARG